MSRGGDEGVGMTTERTSAVGESGDNASESPSGPSPHRWWNLAVTLGIVITLVVGTAALFRLDSLGEDASTPARFQLDLTQQLQVPPELLGYDQLRSTSLSLEKPVAIAVAEDGSVFVAGSTEIAVFDPDGTLRTTLPLAEKPTSLAVAGAEDTYPGRIYVSTERGVLVLDAQGETVAQWPTDNAKSLVTCVRVAGSHVLVADAGLRVVRHYDTDGQLLNVLGQPDADRQMPGFVVPSPFFSLVVDASEIVHIVNPGMRRVEAYNMEGELQSFWGQAGAKLPDFFGCCNPAYLALLPDGRFVTSEKGIPRIKVYSTGGDLEQVVAGPEQLGVSAGALGDARGDQHERLFPVAVDRAGRIHVLDTHRSRMLVFQSRDESAEAR